MIVKTDLKQQEIKELNRRWVIERFTEVPSQVTKLEIKYIK